MKELVVGNPIYDKELKVLGLITALPYGCLLYTSDAADD